MIYPYSFPLNSRFTLAMACNRLCPFKGLARYNKVLMGASKPVSKLLTGFDAPINTLLYLAKPLKGHNLLQAIARVNRLFKGKEYGYIIDYVGILGKLDEALTEYSALEDFDEEDLTNAVSDMTETIRQLPSHHAAVWDIFKTVKNKDDIEALE